MASAADDDTDNAGNIAKNYSDIGRHSGESANFRYVRDAHTREDESAYLVCCRNSHASFQWQ